MTSTPEIQDQIRRYLLGELDDGTRAEVEKRFLSDGEVFEELLVAEDEIIDDYASGRLDPEERADFEAHFLATPERQRKLRFARALHRHAMNLANERETVKQPVIRSLWFGRPGLSWAATTVAALALIVGTVWFLRSRTAPPKTFATLTLTINQSTRAEGAPAAMVKLPLAADALKIFLRLPGSVPPASRYRVVLEADDGETRPLEMSDQDGESIAVVIPATQLKRGQYVLKIFGTGVNGVEQRIPGNYFFTVE